MNLKNYTSTVPVFRTVAEIEAILAEMGASGVTKGFENGSVSAITFHVALGPKSFSVRLPANAKAVFEVMKKDRARTDETWLKAQAERTAWRLQLDWLKVQLSLIRCNQVEALQVFLPYVWDEKSGTTLFQALKSEGYKMLPCSG